MANFDNIIQEINTNLPDNTTQAITAAKLRTTLIDLTDTIDTVQDDFETEVNESINEISNIVSDLNNAKMDKSYPIYETSPLTATDTQYQTGYYITYNGTISTVSGFGILGFDCTENQELLITGSFGGGQSCLGVFQDDNGNNKGLVLQKPILSPYDSTVVSDYYCQVPSGATKIYVQTNKNLLQNPSCKLVVNTTYRQYSEDIIQNETDIYNIQADLEQLKDDFDESIYTEIEYTQTWENIKAYTLVIGSAPSGNTVNQYNSVYIQNLQVGDVVNVYARSGSSYKQYAKVKNGICVEVVNSSLETNFSFAVDNTYDALVFNNYTDYIANPTAIVIKKESTINILSNEIDELQDTVDSFDMYTQVETNLEWTPQQFLDAPAIGSAPSFSTDNSYKTIYIQNLQIGDVVNAKFRAGTSSNKKYGAKVKNGLITELIASVSPYEYTFECDGSFDALIFNQYTGWGWDSYAILVQDVLTTEVLSNEIEDLQETVNDIIEQGVGGEFNLLCFGNSFTQDTISYIPWLIKECEPNIKLNVYFTYTGGMPISECLAYISNGTTIALNSEGNPSTKYENHGGWDRIYSYSNGEWVEPASGTTNYHKSYTLYKYEDGANAWVSQSEPTAASVLQMKNWDLITIQQAGSYNYGEWNYYFKPYVYQIQAELQKQVKHNFTLGYLMTHASYSTSSETLLSHYNGIVQNTTKMLENTPVEIVMPYATALQNARTTYLDRFGAGGHLMGDTAHVSDGVGCLTCAYANTMAILDLIGSKKSIVGSQIYPDAAWLSSHNIPAVSSTIEGLSRYNIWLAQQCAVMATKYPLQLTNMVEKGMCGGIEIEIVNDAVYSSNPILSANNGDSWTTTLIAPDGMTISSVSVVMGSTDITSSVYNSSTKEINIPNVNAKVTITAQVS